MMSVELGMANQYIKDLSANTKRGLREKARRGDFPGPAPIGYLNNPRTKTIMVDRRKTLVVRRAFELYAENNSRLEDISYFFYENGIQTQRRKDGEESPAKIRKSGACPPKPRVARPKRFAKERRRRGAARMTIFPPHI